MHGGIPAIRSALFAVALAVALVTMSACDPSPAVAVIAPDRSTRAVIQVEIVDTPGKREVGLMYRRHLDRDSGMLFVFPRPQAVSFWMKNTIIPLDMIFADPSGRVIGIIANAEPYSVKRLGPFDTTLYVVEVNGGYTAGHGVAVGDRLEFQGFKPHAAQ